MRKALFLIFALIMVVAIHDLQGESCDRWYRIPFQISSELFLGDLPLGGALFKLAYGAHADQQISAYVLPDPWQYRDPRDRGALGWSDVQSGTFAVIPPLEVLVVMPPSWLDRSEFVSLFQRANPRAVRIQDAPGVAPFALVQSGGGVEGLRVQVLLQQSGEVTVWRGREDWYNDLDRLDLARQDRLPSPAARSIIRDASVALTPGVARVYWNCAMFDGLTISLTTYDGKVLSRGHWINYRNPSRQAAPIIERLLAFSADQRL